MGHMKMPFRKKVPAFRSWSLWLACSLFAFACKKQSWSTAVEQLQIPDMGNSTFNAVLVDSSDHVFIFGGDRFERNDFIQSNDNGASWQVFHFNSEPYSNKVLYAGAILGNTVYAVGYDGKIFRSAGFIYDQWRLKQGDYFWFSFTGISFGSPGNGCAVGHTGYERGVIQRIDSAVHTIQVDTFPFAINDIAFADPATAYAVGYGAVLQSLDSGRTWKQLSLTDDNYRAVFAINKDDIWTVGYNGTIARLTEGGTKIKKIKNGQNPFSNTDRYRDIGFKGQDGYIVGEKGVVLYSHDGGASWSKMKKFTSEDIYSLAFHPLRNTVYFVGNKNTAFRATVGE